MPEEKETVSARREPSSCSNSRIVSRTRVSREADLGVGAIDGKEKLQGASVPEMNVARKEGFALWSRTEPHSGIVARRTTRGMAAGNTAEMPVR